jgi:hypothetical protein
MDRNCWVLLSLELDVYEVIVFWYPEPSSGREKKTGLSSSPLRSSGFYPMASGKSTDSDANFGWREA